MPNETQNVEEIKAESLFSEEALNEAKELAALEELATAALEEDTTLLDEANSAETMQTQEAMYNEDFLASYRNQVLAEAAHMVAKHPVGTRVTASQHARCLSQMLMQESK